MNCWPYDLLQRPHSKGINLLSAALATDELAVPIGVAFIRKSIKKRCPDGRVRRRSPVTKNEFFRQLVHQCWHNTRFDYVAADSLFSGTENIDFIKNTLNRAFVMAAKINRLAATNTVDKQAGCWAGIEALAGPDRPLRVWLRGMEFPVLLPGQVFKNEDGSQGMRYPRWIGAT